LQLGKSRKTGKRRANTQNNFGGTPVFLPNGADFEGRNLQAIDYQVNSRKKAQKAHNRKSLCTAIPLNVAF